ncbi:MAG: TetR/AcrR family transcriptional regulator [Bacteroidota bacterium]|nr:TetR/AcrR family transcriptional regulator [Bacteroidota bacterium]
MSPRSKKQFEDIKKQKKKEIMQAALETFGTMGYHAATISQITKKAKISKGLIYSYFDSKEALLKEVVIQGLESIFNIFDPNKDGVLTEDEFEYFIDKMFNVLQNNHKFWKLYFSVLITEEVLEIVEQQITAYIQPFIETLTDYYRRHNKANPEIHATMFGSMLDGVSMGCIIDPKNYPVEEVKKLLIEKFK